MKRVLTTGLSVLLCAGCMLVAGSATAAPPSSMFTYTAGDFDGNGYDDLCVYYPDKGTWNIWYINNGSLGRQESWSFGFGGTIAVPGDYDGDKKDDLAVYYPPDGKWYVRNSRGGATWSTKLGWSETVPVPGDYNGNGQDNLAVYYPNDGSWIIGGFSGGSSKVFKLGFPGAIPVPGDYNGDGRDEVAVYVPAYGGWLAFDVKTGKKVMEMNWGWSSAKPAPADYNADGKLDPCVYEGGNWYINFGNGVQRQLNWGGGDCLPVAGKYRAYKGKFHNAQIAVYYPATGDWVAREALLDFLDPWYASARMGWSQALPPSYRR